VRVARLAAPVVLANLSQTLMGLVDTVMVSRLGTAEVAAVGVATLLWAILANALKSLDVAVQSVVARRVGEGDAGAVGQVLTTALVMVVAAGALATLQGMLWPGAWLGAILDDPHARALGARYLLWRWAGLLPFLCYFQLRACFDGIGWTRVGMVTGIGMNLVNVGLNWVLIFGKLGAPPLGVAGAAIASGGSSLLALLAIGAFALRGRVRRRFRFFARGNLRRDVAALLLRVGWPPALQAAGLVAGLALFYVALGRISTVAVAAANIVMRVAALSLMPGFGIAVAVQTLVGQALGAGNAREALRTGQAGVLVGMGFMAVVGAVFLLFPEPVLAAFQPEPGLLAAARPILRLTAGLQVIAAVGIVLGGALRGAGATRPVMLVDVLTGGLVLLPAAWLAVLVLHAGLVGAWLALVGWVAVHALVMLRLFRRASWLRVRL